MNKVLKQFRKAGKTLTLALALNVVAIHTIEYVDGGASLAQMERESSLEETLQEASWIISDYEQSRWYWKAVSHGYYLAARNYMYRRAYKLQRILLPYERASPDEVQTNAQ